MANFQLNKLTDHRDTLTRKKKKNQEKKMGPHTNPAFTAHIYQGCQSTVSKILTNYTGLPPAAVTAREWANFATNQPTKSSEIILLFWESLEGVKKQENKVVQG